MSDSPNPDPTPDPTPKRPRGRIANERGLEPVGMVWLRQRDDTWERQLLRRYRRTGSLDWCQLTHVRPQDGEFCMLCLSQNLIPCHLDTGWYDCQDCGAFFAVQRAYGAE